MKASPSLPDTYQRRLNRHHSKALIMRGREDIFLHRQRPRPTNLRRTFWLHFDEFQDTEVRRDYLRRTRLFVLRARGFVGLLRSNSFRLSTPGSSNLTAMPEAGRGIETAKNGDVRTCVVTSPDTGRRSLTLTASTVPMRLMPVISTL